MVVNNDPNLNGTVAQTKNIDIHSTSFRWQPQIAATLGWKEAQRNSAEKRSLPSIKRRRRLLGGIVVILLIMLIFASVRVSTMVSDSNDQLQVQIGNQQTAIIDLR